MDFLLPTQCAGCQVLLRRSDGRTLTGFCDDCRNRLIPSDLQQCPRCSAPVGPNLSTREGCQLCREEKFAFQEVVSLGPYRGELGRVILQAKKSSGESLTASLGEELCTRHGPRIKSWEVDAVVAVPHFWLERSFRKQIPASTLADVLGRFLKVPVARHILSKRRWTRPQASLPATKRRQNLNKAFQISGRARLDGLKVLLVDDVLTTGTTADRVSRVLRSAGADQVYVAVLARGTGDTQAPPV